MPAKPAAAARDAARRALHDQFSGRANRAFYVAVLAVALTGSAMAAEDWLDWWFVAALGAVALAELGGVALSVFADRRRQLGERAIFARLLSAAVAAGAVAIQFFGHHGKLGVAFFFAGFSLLGYLVFLLDSAARRRDALREAGKLPDTPPAYGAWQWMAHPWLTRRARALFLVNAEQRLVERLAAIDAGAEPVPTTPLLGRLASLDAAEREVRAIRRRAAIKKALRRRIGRAVDGNLATLFINTADLDAVAEALIAGADYPGFAALIGRELVPARIAAAPPRRRWWGARGTGPTTTGTGPAQIGTGPGTGLAATIATAITAAAPAPPVVPEGAKLLPLVELAGPVPAPVETGPVVPDDVALLPVLAHPPKITITAPETAPPAPVETGPAFDIAAAVEAALARGPRVDPPLVPPAPDVLDETGPTGPETDEQPPAPETIEIPEKLRPIVERVMAARQDWHLAVTLPGKHPDGLSASKIQEVGQTGSKQYALDVQKLLAKLAQDRVAALSLVDPDGSRGINRKRSTAASR